MTHFKDLGLDAALLKALDQQGYQTPTPIQAASIPELLKGTDLLGIAQTGTGKTAAFALPILDRLSKLKGRPDRGTCRALILSPTRELAAQIGESFRTYGKFLRLTQAVVFGGVSINNQIRTVGNGVDILIATPGRLVDLIDRRVLSLGKIEVFVLDEVDQMLDLGFIHAIRKITGLLPAKRQNLFFSATMPKEIAGLAAALLRDPVRVEITPVATTAERVNQSIIHVETRNKLGLLLDLLENGAMPRTLVFTRTKHGADKVVKGLIQKRIEAAAIHGNKSQSQRELALAGFKSSKLRVLVATDIAARGIDVDGVSHVVNYDLPFVPDSYVHRIGRTARAGASGEAVAFCDPEERPLLRDIERTIRQKIPVAQHALSIAAPEGNERSGGPQGHHRPQQNQPSWRKKPGHKQQNGGGKWRPKQQQRQGGGGGQHR
ncbi:DEAD/DEAH box helicase [Nordella sp. HKS 07]|uniref:DEAD/DEAH box helicase n=1 Tax=Nordella sp. HKS 07 TaxID=2712222 RepID=UPI0013E1AD69|nr:DEAD/DEAH box helicase [Nordella sp. HKS 07]QIG47873.1 DEAD/DEAH box helicase [Nordella sp. HKS 07]